VPVTPDRFPGESDDEGLILSDEGVDPTVVGEIRLNSGVIKGKDSTGVFNLRSGTGLSDATHESLLQLIHFIDEGPAHGFTTGATKTITGTTFPTNITWRRADTTRLVEKIIVWSGPVPTLIRWAIYDVDGSTVLSAVVDTISYSGVFETGRTRSIT